MTPENDSRIDDAWLSHFIGTKAAPAPEGAVTPAPIHNTNSAELVDQLLRIRMQAPIRKMLRLENPELSEDALEALVKKRLASTIAGFHPAQKPPVPEGTPKREPEAAATENSADSAASEQEVVAALQGGTIADKVTDPVFRKSLLRYLRQPGVVADETMTQTLLAGFRAAPESDSELREQIFGKAFACQLHTGSEGGGGSVPAKVLNRIVAILETLPREHLPAHWDLRGEAKEESPQGPDMTVRQEAGHAVYSGRDGEALTSSPEGGEWQVHGKFDQVIKEFSREVIDFAVALQKALNLPKALDAEKLRDLIGALREDDFKDSPKFGKALASTLVEAKAVPLPAQFVRPGDRVAYLLPRLPLSHGLVQLIVQGGRKQPHLHLSGAPKAVNGRVYIHTEKAGGWASFAAAAYRSKVSMYQFRSPDDWFAEFYAAANSGDAGVRKQTAAQSPAAFEWLKDKGLLLYPED